MKISKNGLELIKKLEGCRVTAYLDSKGVPTIGYGHTGKVGGDPIIAGVTKITLGQAVELLMSDLEYFESTVSKYVKVKLNQNQFDALTIFCFNCGAGNFLGSTLLKKLNAKDFNGAADEFPKWNKITVKKTIIVNGKKQTTKAKEECPGLTNRRAAELKLFLS